MNNTRRIRMAITTMLLLAVAAAGYACYSSHAVHTYLAVSVLVLAAASSRMKIKLPGINGNMSVNLPFLVTAVLNLSAAEAVFVACFSTAAQCWPSRRAKFNSQQITFNLSMMAFATAMASVLSHANWLPANPAPWRTSLCITVAATTLFLGQTLPVAIIVALSDCKKILHLWRQLAQLSLPYYVLSAGVTSMVQAVGGFLGWGLALGVFPLMYAIHLSFRLYFSRMVETARPEILVRAAGAGS
ncbi:MAG TPA: hypothetical protein VJQ54_06115 [Candidatus Sulfotelmatobacter sp.]|nr:hypothetical protein [Candidatus Sulfotelmatobacter sp.]